MQQLEICLLTDLPTTGAYISFQLTFKITVFLSGSYRHKVEYNSCRVSISVLGIRREKCRKEIYRSMAAFEIVHAGQRTTGKIFLTFQSFSLRVLPPAAKK